MSSSGIAVLDSFAKPRSYGTVTIPAFHIAVKGMADIAERGSISRGSGLRENNRSFANGRLARFPKTTHGF